MPRELVALDVRKPALREYEDGPVPEGRVRVKVEFGSPKRGTELTMYRGDRMPGFPMGLGNMCVGRIAEIGTPFASRADSTSDVELRSNRREIPQLELMWRGTGISFVLIPA